MNLPVILILVGVFSIVAVSQIIIFKKFLKNRREELNK